MALLDDVLAAYGGLDRWRQARTIRARVHSGGLMIATRAPRLFAGHARLTLRVAEPWLLFEPAGSSDQMLFEGRRVSHRGPDGEPQGTREDPRSAFFGVSGLRRNLFWDVLDTTYFVGYALWNYMTMPYLLARDDVEVREGPTLESGGERWRRLDARFPPDVVTHSRRQSFYFCDRGLLMRHDYTPDVVTKWVRTAHFCADHREAGGLVFATRRWVYPILPGGWVAPGPKMVAIDIDDIEVEGID